MPKVASPYSNQPSKAFWRASISERHVSQFEDLWEPIDIKSTDRVGTAGSCFAQHIGRQLRRRGARLIDVEPAPAFLADETDSLRFGYGIFSARYGNIYSSRQLIQLARECSGTRDPCDVVWEKDGRFFDALRPSVDPVGQADAATVLALRRAHLSKVKALFEGVDCFVFTLGLTEIWEHAEDGTAYPTAPGVIAGHYDADRYRLRNLRYPEIYEDVSQFIDFLRRSNPKVRVLLTVSPVPLVATATNNHVLVATTYSKSVLRSVASDLAADHPGVTYFPSYEIITTHPSRAMFFEPDLRSVSEMGVNLVMEHFFRGSPELRTKTAQQPISDGTICDEEQIQKFAGAEP